MECYYCGKRFASSYSLGRHKERYHPKQASTQSSAKDKTSEEEDEQEPLMETDSQVENVSEASQEVVTMESGSEDEETKVESFRAWLSLAHQTFENVEDLISDSSRDFNALHALRKKFKVLDKLVDNIRSSKLYGIIDTENQNLLEKGYEESEADFMAWHNHRFIILNELKDMIDNETEEAADD